MLDNVFDSTKNWCQNKGLVTLHKASVDSTNDWAKREINAVQDLSVFLAEEQTAGRGRGTNSWSNSTLGESLLVTLVFPLSSPPQPISSPCFGLALFRSARAIWPSLEWSLKAPNDLQLGGKKIAGLLLETIQTGNQIHLLVGLGMNVLGHPETEKNAVHLNGEEGLGDQLSSEKWDMFLDQWLSNFDLASHACLKTELDAQYRDELVEALNRNPSQQQPVIEVSESGDLVYDDKTVSWKDL